MFKKSDVKDIYSLSPLQEGILFHYLEDDRSHVYFEQAGIKVSGDFRLDLFEKTFNRLIEKYDILRTVFTYKQVGRPQQVVLKKREVQINFKDISHWPEQEKVTFIRNFEEKDKQRSFNLSKDIPMRISTVKLAANDYYIIWSFHHIIMDGWCLGIIIKDFFSFYQQLEKGKMEAVVPAKPYSEYIRWLERQDKEEGIRYWERYLEGYNQPAVLTNFARTSYSDAYYSTYPEGDYIQQYYRFELDDALTKAVEQMAQKNEVTVNTILQTTWGILLQRYNNTEDVVYGATVSGRPPEIEGIETMVGLFINAIPIRIRSTHPQETYAQLLRKVQQQETLSKSYEYFPLAEIQSKSLLKRKLIDHLLILENYPVTEEVKTIDSEKSMGIKIKEMKMFEQINYDFNIEVGILRKILINFNYNAARYEKTALEKIARHIQEVVKQVTQNPGIIVGDIDIIPDEEKKKILVDFNNNMADFSYDKSVHQLIEAQVQKHPQHTAVLFQDQHITAAHLNEKANQLAHLLRIHGITRDKPVGIILERTPLLMETILAIWKAGGAYIPLDPQDPIKRIMGILTDGDVHVVIGQSEGIPGELHHRRTGKLKIILLEENKPGIEMQSRENLGLNHDMQSLAYIIYTSGTTGKPKGVMVEHIGMINHIQAKINDLAISETAVTAQNASYTFDISVWQFFSALTVGGRTVIYPEEIIMNPDLFLYRIRRDGVTHWEVVPSYLALILDSLEIDAVIPLKFLLVTGETVKPHLVMRWYEKYPGIPVVNAYGPTEASDDITHYKIDQAAEWGESAQIPIGKPLQNFNIYIVDEHFKLSPLGVIGEICAAGIGVGRGYLNDPEKTDHAFRPDPFTKKNTTRLYKTGDLGYWLADGNIAFMERKDNQVKIRGFRIEPGEIESKLESHSEIKNAVVVEKEDHQGRKFLCAYLVRKSPTKLNIPGIREYLSNKLPEYMVPAYFLELSQIPLTPNGKIDRKALPDPEPESKTHRPPRDEKEEKLASVLSEVLGIDKKNIGIDANFFELGGDSIKAIQVSARLRKHQLNLEIRDLFLNSTLESAAKAIKSLGYVIDQKAIEGKVELTPIQMDFFWSNLTDPHHYNLSVMIYSEMGFEEGIIQKVFTRILEHHDALRMIFPPGTKGDIAQWNRAPGEKEKYFDFLVIHVENDIEREIETKATQLQESMDLTAGPLVKLGLFKTKEGDHLLIAIHHLVVDGVSWRIILEDFAIGYNQALRGKEIEFPPKTDSFKYWSEKIKEISGSSAILAELDYWKNLEQMQITPLPRDYEPDIGRRKNKFNEEVKMELSIEETHQLLKETNRAYNTEINDVLLTALAMAIKDWCGIERVLIELEGHGREGIIEGINISRTVGWFTSQYPVILDIESPGDPIPRESDYISLNLKKVKETMRRILNKGIGYGILKYLTPGENKGGINFRLRPQIGFNYLGDLGFGNNKNRMIKISTQSMGESVSAEMEMIYTLNINAMVLEGKFTQVIAYNRFEFRRSTIEQLVQGFQSCLGKIIHHCLEKEERAITPSDLTYSNLTINELEVLENMIKDLN